MRFIILIFAVSLYTGAYAQIENSSSELRIGRGEKSIGREGGSLEAPNISRGFSVGENKKSLLGQPDAPNLMDIDKDDGKIDMTAESEYITRTIKYKPGYLKNSTGRDGAIYEEFSKPQDLGKYTTDGDYVIVSWRDAQVVDGDRVDIIVNDEVVVHNVTLLAQYHSIRVDLKKGFTKIEFKALNQGESGPNTADFKVQEANGNVLTHDEWNLTTGTKAHLVVVKN